MNIISAIKSGKPFKRKDWGENWYITNKYDIVRLDSQDNTLILDICDMLADDWELKQEPRKVTLYRYLYKGESGTHLTVWTSVDWSLAKHNYCNVELLKTFTKEIEY